MTEKITVGELLNNNKIIKSNLIEQFNKDSKEIKNFFNTQKYLPYFMWKSDVAYTKQKSYNEYCKFITNKKLTNLFLSLPIRQIDSLIYIENIDSYINDYIEDFYYPFTFITNDNKWFDFDSTDEINEESFSSFVNNYLQKIPTNYIVWSIEYEN